MNKKSFKILLFLVTAMAVTSDMYAQKREQTVFVKTRGKWVDGHVERGHGLMGAEVKVKGQKPIIVNNPNGSITIPLTEDYFTIESVEIQGYELITDVLPRQYRYSVNPLYLLMETPERRDAELLETQKKILSAFRKQLKEREAELEAVKAKCKLREEELNRKIDDARSQLAALKSQSASATKEQERQIKELETKVDELETQLDVNDAEEQENRRKMQSLYADGEKNQKLAEEMAKRYTELDFDNLDELNQRISAAIIDGRLSEADSLLRTKGDINERLSQLIAANEANKKDREDLAQDIYYKFDSFKLQQRNDLAQYYIELRASIDSLNYDWQKDAALFISECILDYRKAMKYYERMLRHAECENNQWLQACIYNDIGDNWEKQDNYTMALQSYEHSLRVKIQMFGTNHSEIANQYKKSVIFIGI